MVAGSCESSGISKALEEMTGFRKVGVTAVARY